MRFSKPKDIGESAYFDLDKNGNLVSITIEHARNNTKLEEFSYQEIIGQVRKEAKRGLRRK